MIPATLSKFLRIDFVALAMARKHLSHTQSDPHVKFILAVNDRLMLACKILFNERKLTMPYVPLVDHALAIQPATTKTADFNGPALDMGQGFKPASLGQLAGVVIEVTAIDRTTGDETYAFKVQESADGTNDWTDIGPPVSTSEVGIVVAKAIITARFIRLVLDVNGTTPSVTYSALVGLDH